MADVALKTEIYSGAAPGATVKVPGLTANNVAFTAFDVTPVALTVLDDATIAALRATIGPYNASDYWEIYEEFVSGNATSATAGSHGWRFTGTLGGIAGEANHPGIARYVPTNGGAATVEFFAITGPNATLGAAVYDDVDGFAGCYRFNATADGDHRFGIMNAAVNVTATSGIYLEHLAADTNWFACVRSAAGANITRTDTTVAFGTGWISARARRGATGWVFNVNGGADLAEITTNLPTGTLAASLGLQQVKATTAQPTIDADMFAVWGAITR
jgi:hypothetical protein